MIKRSTTEESVRLGETLRNLRTRHKVTQEEMAVALKVTRSCISYWETGATNISALDFKKFCEYLGENWVDILKNL